jgi:hypothetical protein
MVRSTSQVDDEVSRLGTIMSQGYTITAAPNGDTFTWAKNSKGEITRTCDAKGAGGRGGCQTGSW